VESGLLCEHGGFERGSDPQVCTLAGAEGARAGAASVRLILGGLAHGAPFQGRHKQATTSGGGHLTVNGE